MSRRFWRASGRQAGFSFVELLVTIIIAGIAFVALVPVFVSAQQKGGQAERRTAAINLAQDRLERLRQLPWNALSDSLTATPVAGLTWGDVTVSGKTYTVDLLGVTAAGDGQKTVTVRVSWAESGGQGKVQLSTNIFRQLPGPQITDLSFFPQPDPNAPSQGNWIRVLNGAGDVTITATVNPAQVLDCKRVRFTVVDMSGLLQPVVQYVETPVPGTDNQFALTWKGVDKTGTVVPLHDGLYRVSAVAYSKDDPVDGSSYPGNTYPRDIRIETGVPPAVDFSVYEGKIATPTVNLLWSPSSAADWDHFEVWRADSAGAYSMISEKVYSFGYVDAVGLTDGETYSYIVRAVDTAGNALPLESLTGKQASPVTSGAGAPPPQPIGLRVSFSGANVKIDWTPPASLARVTGYHVYRDADADHSSKTLVAVAASLPSVSSYAAYDRSIEWSTAYSYTVVAFAADGIESAAASLVTGQTYDASAWATITTPNAPIYDLRMSVYVKKDTQVYVKDATTGAVVAEYTATKFEPAASRQIPYGNYTVNADTKSIAVTLTGDPSQPVYVALSL